MDAQLNVRPVETSDLPEILALHDRVFGPGRFVRTAYRVREGTQPVSRFCLLAQLGGKLVAAIRFTEVTIGGKPGALLLGPLVVAAEHAGLGYGRRLVAEGLEAARRAGIALIVLVGDEPYYAKLGFKRLPPDRVILPGPVDPQRLLAAELVPGAAEAYAGRLIAAK